MEKWFVPWNKSKINVFLSSKAKAASHCGTLMRVYDCIDGIVVCTPSSQVFIPHAALHWRRSFVRWTIHKSTPHLITAHVALCPRPPSNTLPPSSAAFHSVSPVFLPLLFPLRSSPSSQCSSVSVGSLSVLFHSVLPSSSTLSILQCASVAPCLPS